VLCRFLELSTAEERVVGIFRRRASRASRLHRRNLQVADGRTDGQPDGRCVFSGAKSIAPPRTHARTPAPQQTSRQQQQQQQQKSVTGHLPAPRPDICSGNQQLPG